MKLENYIPFMILLLIISILLIWYQNTFDSQWLQEKIERSDTSDLEEIYWNMQNNSTWKWEDLHNLWYLSYLIWNQKKENIDILQESYNYFLESFELWADLRTKHNLEVINKLLEQKNKIPEKREDSIEQEKEESPINPQNESQIPESSENTPEDEVSWENKPEDNNTSSWKQSEENQDEEWTPSIPVFLDIGYNSEEELLQELELYSSQIQDTSLQYRPYIGEQFNDNLSPFSDIFSDFFWREWWFLWETPGQSEKDW